MHRTPNPRRIAAALALCVPGGRTLGLATALLALGACRDPTQVRVTLTTDALCADVTETSITTGQLTALDGVPPVAVTSACGVAGRIGDLVIVPSDGNGDTFGVRVVTGLNKSADDCVKDGFVGGCIVARRSLRFLPHRTVDLPIPLEVACRDVPCNATQTCRHGQCVSADVDPTQCSSPSGCDVGGSATDPDAGNAGEPDAGSAGARDADAGEAGSSTGGSASGGTSGIGGDASIAGSNDDDAGPSACGNGVIDPGEACDDGNQLPGDGCVGCSIEKNWGCRDEPSACSAVSSLVVGVDGQDDLASDALDKVFSGAKLDERSFLYLGVTAPAPHGFEYCLERADWYAMQYAANADGDLPVTSGDWQKWWRSPGGVWSAPDTTGYVSYFGTACEPRGRSMCLEWMLGDQLMSLQPAWTDGDEVFSNGYVDGTVKWNVAFRVGPTRESVCGF